MGPLGMMAIGAGVGLAKDQFIDQPRRARQRTLAAETAKYSPWTGMNSQSMMPEEGSGFESALQGGTAGAMMGQGAQAADQQKQMAELQKRNLQLQNSWLNMGQSPASNYSYNYGGPGQAGFVS